MNPRALLDGRLKLRHLVLVDALTEAGTVVGAAAALHVTQPVVTRALKEIEQILTVKLYERGPRGITPTEYGIAFTEHARAVLAQLTQAQKHLEELSDATRGAVSIGTHLAGSHFLLPRAIARIKARHPRLSLSVTEASPDQLLVDLRAGRLDMVIGRLPESPDEDLDQQVMLRDTVRVMVGSQNPLASREQITAADLAECSWILPGSGTLLRTELERWFTANQLSIPSALVEATNYLTVRQLLVETDMIATLPGMLSAEDPRLTSLPIELGRVGRDIGLTLMRGRRLTPASHAMIRHVRATAAELIRTYGDYHLEPPGRDQPGLPDSRPA